MSKATPLSELTLGQLDSRVAVPRYDRSSLSAGILHIGVGGFHRAHLATYADELAAQGHRDWGIAGAGVLPTDTGMADALEAQQGLYSLVTRGAAGTSVQVIGSLLGYTLASDDTEPLIRQLADPAVRIVSLTVTEGGYPVDESNRTFDSSVAPAGPGSAFGAIAEALRRRRDSGSGPLTIMSCDNVIGNGDVARLAVIGAADALLDPSVPAWIERNVSFPNGMVDRITPTTTDADREFLAVEYGLADRWPVVAEPFRQWVIEDEFAGGRPPWEDLDITVTTDVEPYELMKLRLLNAGHSLLAYVSALAGIDLVHEAMAEPAIGEFVGTFLEVEASPVLPPIPGIDVADYRATLVKRFRNPAIADQISRLCQDGSAKFPKFLLPTVRAQLQRGGPVGLAALGLAGWCNYLTGTGDDGRPIELSYDSDLEVARKYAEASLGDPAAFLGYERVFDAELASDRRFRAAFVDALEGLRSHGALATLATALRDR